MQINLRNALMAGKRLPYDAELEYLESTGTQWIDTGIVATENTRVKATLLTLSTGNKNWFGGQVTGSSVSASGFCFNSYNSNTVEWLFGNSGWHTPAVSDIVGRIFTVDFSKDGVVIDGITVATPSYTTFAQQSAPIAIFVRIGGFGFINGRLYAFQIYQNGTLVRDYIPVRVGTVGYLYDRVTRKLFGNEGTGDFVLGPDIVPVEYIESRSNIAQKIDTGFYANQNTKALITFEKLGPSGWLFGSRNGSSSATDKFGIFVYQSPDGKISAQVGNTYIEPTISGGLTNRKKTIELSLADGVIVDGETIATFSESQKSQTFTSTYPMALFNMRVSSSGFNIGIYCRVYAYQIFENGLIARNFRPVRVGTDATSWDGAMMDVLTRRIYRNAGTGAFTYGNDLKYPIPAE